VAGGQAVSRLLVAIDVDGTLVGESLTISPPDAAAIRVAVSEGNAICLASGRLFAAARPYALELGLTGPVIALQGAVAYEVASGKRLYCTALARDTALRAYDDLKARGLHVQLYFGDRLYLDVLNDWARYYLRLSRVEPVVVADLRELLTTKPPADPGPIKILAIAQPDIVSATIPALAQVMGASANVFRSLPPFLEVTHPDANKGYALRWIARYLGIDMSNTAAIGDADNDVPMFQAAARSFAVANASDAAKRCASTIVPELGAGVAFALHLLQEETAHEPA
jgi:Cof subfamily protein (haloacid dehalogenase superfamily)